MITESCIENNYRYLNAYERPSLYKGKVVYRRVVTGLYGHKEGDQWRYGLSANEIKAIMAGEGLEPTEIEAAFKYLLANRCNAVVCADGRALPERTVNLSPIWVLADAIQYAGRGAFRLKGQTVTRGRALSYLVAAGVALDRAESILEDMTQDAIYWREFKRQRLIASKIPAQF